MNAAAVTVGVLVALLGALAYLVVCDLLSQEIRTRLFRLPFWILRLAARQLPAELRTEIYKETWLPDVHFILQDEQIGPITRLIRATSYAVSTWLRRGGAQMADVLVEITPPSMEGFEDIRALPRGHRRRFGVLTERLHDLLQRSGTFDQDDAVRLLTLTASACEAYIDDRDEGTAKNLAEAARSLAESLSPGHPAVFAVRRAHAHALLQLGHPQRAEALLSELSGDEIRIFGSDAPETFQTRRLLGWALANEGRFQEAEAEFCSLAAQLPDGVAPLRLHIQCMLSWTAFCQGHRHEAENGYDVVIASRSRGLGPHHPDTLDARHSKGKMFVKAGDPAQALAVLRPLLADRRRVLGAHHPDTLETRKYLAVACALMGPRRNALAQRKSLRELRYILRTQTSKHGPDYPNTRDTYSWIAMLTGSAEDQ